MYQLIKEALVALSDYQEHLEKVYKMDTFYGDSTLEGLLDHSKDIKTGLEQIVRTMQGFFDEKPSEEEKPREEEADAEEA